MSGKYGFFLYITTFKSTRHTYIHTQKYSSSSQGFIPSSSWVRVCMCVYVLRKNAMNYANLFILSIYVYIYLFYLVLLLRFFTLSFDIWSKNGDDWLIIESCETLINWIKTLIPLQLWIFFFGVLSKLSVLYTKFTWK